MHRKISDMFWCVVLVVIVMSSTTMFSTNIGVFAAGAQTTRAAPPLLQEYIIRYERSANIRRIEMALSAELGNRLPKSHSNTTVNEVTWEAAWWSLVPLALGAMTQPCGKVLGRSEENFRFYSRSSPIVCIADVIHFVTLVGLGFSFDRRVFLRNIKYELRQRFAGGGDKDPTNAEKTRIIRWSVMVLGGIPCQTVKLVVMDGLFWTKTWAVMFLVSIVFGEVVPIFARRYDTNHVVDFGKPRWRTEQWEKHLNLAFHVPFTCHCHVVYSVAATLSYWLLLFVSEMDFYIATSLCVTTAIILEASTIFLLFNRRRAVTVQAVLRCIVLIILWELLQMICWEKTTSQLRLNWEQRRPQVDQYLRQIKRPSKSHLADVLLPWTDIILGSRPEMLSHVLFLIYEILAASCMSILIPNVLYSALLQHALKLSSPEVSHAVFICISTFFFSPLWYWLMFQSQGTYNPTWTEIFA